MKTHRDLDVWINSIKLVEEIYKLTANYPKEEIYGIVSQIRRAAVSIPSNIAEGAARSHDKEFMQFLYIALGSIAELDTQLVISDKLGYIKTDELEKIENNTKIIRNQILGLIKYLREKKT
jgi:four helix bundle protein